METKTCTKCGETKAMEEFSRDKSRKDGRCPHCKSCSAANGRRWYEANRSRVAENGSRWRVENKDANDEKNRRWREANRDQVRETSKAWYVENKDRKAATERAWRTANPENVSRTKKRYRDRHPESAREYRQTHPDIQRAARHRRRAREAAATVEPFTPADLRSDWEEVDLYACFFCGTDLTSTGLHEEHFYPLSPRREWRGPHAIWNLVPSCPPCNLSKSDREPWTFLRAALAERGTDLDACLAIFDEDGRLIRPTTSVDDEPPPGVTRLTS